MKTVKLASFKIIGIAIRTSNENGKSQQEIGELWGNFMSKSLIDKIPNKESNSIYCLYTDYESDHNGAYTTILGCCVSSLDEIPEGFIGREFTEARYQLYISKGKLPECVGETWLKIWESKIDRRYLCDFDVYIYKAEKPVEVETYVSIN